MAVFLLYAMENGQFALGPKTDLHVVSGKWLFLPFLLSILTVRIVRAAAALADETSCFVCSDLHGYAGRLDGFSILNVARSLPPTNVGIGSCEPPQPVRSKNPQLIQTVG
ncbi:hypothetical protein AB664_05735 [Brucella anthropi]|uniref:Uncharacterized protein n=1 Tax=Brucella anthropi TaxID=529 RepID=A0A656Z4V0_BRUAN|nr:hypothetical protein AB664_05735 [Brucella anthropi]